MYRHSTHRSDPAREFTLRLLTAGALLALLLPTSAAGSEPESATPSIDESAQASDPDGMSLHGDEEGTVLKSLTIEGEDRIQIEFDRPELNLAIDGYAIAGLSWGQTMDVVQRQEVDAFSPMIATSRTNPTSSLGRPWLGQFRSGSVARFRPSLEKVEWWKLTIADSGGETVRVFEDKGSPPDHIVWDGVYASGELAVPGLTYSYVLEARDKAGNRRNFVGPGFEVAPFRIQRDQRLDLVMSGRTLVGPEAANRPADADDPWLVEAASWLNQHASANEPIEIHVAARNFELAEAMGEVAREQLAHYLPGPPARVRVITEARSEAPQAGVVRISTGI
jgi:hypothetical protein